MIGYYKYDIYDYIEGVFGLIVIVALCVIPFLLIFRSWTMKTHKQFDKLAEQCYVKTGSVQTDHFDYVKFAELIVRECAGIACQYDEPRLWDGLEKN